MEAPSSKIIPFQATLRESRHWDSETVYHTGDAFFSHLLADIDRAEQSVDLEMYIFALDELGQRVLEALRRAAARGVRVRVMVDGVGSPEWSRSTLADLDEKGVQARIFRPYPWVRLGFGFVPKIFNFRKMSRWFEVLNRRDHRKVCAIDERIAWLGSFNVTKIHLQEFSREEAWRDTGVRVEGGEVLTLLMAFERAWARAWSPLKKRSWFKGRRRLDRKDWLRHQTLVRLNFAQFLRRRNYEGLLHRIWSSRERVWITSAYFIPERPLIRALRAAAWGGVDVRILLPGRSDVKSARWITFAFLYGVLKAGVRVYQFHPHVLHAKTVLIDHWATIGSSNLNFRSLHHDLEVDVVVEKGESILSLEKQFPRDLAFSEELTLEKWRDKFWLERLLGRVVFFLRYWM